MLQQRLAQAVAAPGRVDVKVFQVQAGFGEESGKVVEEEGEADRLKRAAGFDFNQHRLGVRRAAEQRFLDLLRRGFDDMRQLLVFGERQDQVEQRFAVAGGGGADGEGGLGHAGCLRCSEQIAIIA
ncbi:hypothetical protein D3C72_2022160 [compost metagenome]